MTEKEKIIEINIKENCLVLTVISGHLDISNYHTFHDETVEIIHNSNKKIFILDLSYVGFVGSIGIGIIVFIARKIKNEIPFGMFRICQATDRVRILFELVKLSQIIKIYDSLGDAVSGEVVLAAEEIA